MKTLYIITLIVLLSGCGQYTLVPAGNAKTTAISVDTPIAWNQSPFTLGPSTTVWTADGETLNRVIFINGVEDGLAVFKNTSQDITMPLFDKSMLPHEIEELIISSIDNLSQGQVKIDATNLRPANFGTLDGFRFDLEYFTVNGLLTRGSALATINDGKLYAIIFNAASLHYYEKYSQEVEKMFSSISII